MPCPVFENGEKLVIQRGGGFCTVKSTPEREQAAVTFLKWLTDPQRNVEFVTKVGYMPVKQESFDVYLPTAIEALDDPKYVELYKAFWKRRKTTHSIRCPRWIPTWIWRPVLKKASGFS